MWKFHLVWLKISINRFVYFLCVSLLSVSTWNQKKKGKRKSLKCQIKFHHFIIFELHINIESLLLLSFCGESFFTLQITANIRIFSKFPVFRLFFHQNVITSYLLWKKHNFSVNSAQIDEMDWWILLWTLTNVVSLCVVVMCCGFALFGCCCSTYMLLSFLRSDTEQIFSLRSSAWKLRRRAFLYLLSK